MIDVTENDLDELRDIEARVVTEEFLRARRPWPMRVLPVRRRRADTLEVGYVRMGEAQLIADPCVYTDAGPVTQRRYASLAQLLEAGWRVD